jgi:hypothetical protein
LAVKRFGPCASSGVAGTRGRDLVACDWLKLGIRITRGSAVIGVSERGMHILRHGL